MQYISMTFIFFIYQCPDVIRINIYYVAKIRYLSRYRKHVRMITFFRARILPSNKHDRTLYKPGNKSPYV